MSIPFVTGYVLGRRDAAAGALRAAAVPAAGSADAADLLDVHDRIDRLLLVVAALTSLLEDAGTVTEAELADRIRHMDEADGTPDGRRTPAASRCHSCASAVAPDLDARQFCGTPLPADSTPSPLDKV